MKTLLQICNENKCDKGTEASTAHHYYRVYEKDFESVRNDPINILEVGILRGSSHKCWLEYFPNAQIYGIDTFERIPPEKIPVLSDPRVHYIKHDSTDMELPNVIRKEWGDVRFDFIIDDGLHMPTANRKTFVNLIDFMKEDGAYFIEDIFPLHILTPEQWKHSWLQRLPREYNMGTWKSFMDTLRPYKVGTWDFRRQSRKPDSVIYRISRKDNE